MKQKRCAFLTMQSTEGWSIDAHLAIPPMQARMWNVESVPWRAGGTDWNSFDAVYIGTPWDYPQHLSQFLSVLKEIDKSGAVLVNDYSLACWNVRKTYLRDLEQRGSAIVPSLWGDSLAAGAFFAFFDKLSSDRVVIKPVVSTNAADTFLLERATAAANEQRLLQTFSARAFVVQPFIEAITTEGEYSLFYLGGKYSHAIRKVPKQRDFRVQEEHGAEVLSATPDSCILETAGAILQLVDPLPMYARCDLVRGPDGHYLLMELELIEPSLYLRMDTAAPERFAVEFDRYVAAGKTTA